MGGAWWRHAWTALSPLERLLHLALPAPHRFAFSPAVSGQEFLNRYQELVLTVQGLSLPLRMPSLHPTTVQGPQRQPQQQPQRRCHAHTHPHAHGHHLRQLAARPPLLTWA